jgi:hypothetical protein
VVFASAYHAKTLALRRRRNSYESSSFEALTGDFLPTRLGEEPTERIFTAEIAEFAEKKAEKSREGDCQHEADWFP